MSVQSDKWIKKMAKEHGMIKPFEEEGLDNCMSLIEYINDEVM